MSFSSWLQWLKRPPSRKGNVRRSFVPRLDHLEDRAVPAAFDILHVADAGSGGLMGPFAAKAGNPGNDARAPDLSAYPKLQVPEGNKVSFHAYAEGVQIYRWDGTSWAFVAPEATLYADAGHHGVVGTHYAGPTWESNSGSKVVGAVLERATPDPDSIPWLKLEAKSNDGPGIFDRVTYIQRVNTEGGKAPTAPGTQVGEVVNVPYTAEYYFYRAQQ